MAKKSPVHVEPHQDGWAVVREGNERATSIHPTQAEAAKEGRDIARKEETEFFLHAQDGRVREHNSYVKDEPPLQRKKVAGRADQEAPKEQEEVGREGGDPVVRASDAAEQDHGEPEPLGEGTGHTQEVQGSVAGQLDKRSRELQERYASYLVRDINGEKIGEIDHLFVDENDQLEYFGSKADPTGARSILIPMAVSRVDDERQMIEVNDLKYMIEDGPAFESEEEITPELERRVCDYYGITFVEPSAKQAVYVANYAASVASRGEEESTAKAEGVSTGEGEFRMQRAEEELRVGTRKREVGAVIVRKRVVTEYEQIEVPKKRVEVTVERVPGEGEAPSVERQSSAIPEFEEDEIVVPAVEEDEIVVPVVEEEVVVEKRPVVKEEIRIRKDVVEDTEIVEEKVRREEVEVDDQT